MVSSISSPPQTHISRPVRTVKQAAPNFSANQPQDTTRAGNKRNEPSLFKTLFESPLPVWRRPLAFFFPSNLKAGFDKARAAFDAKTKQNQKGNELVSLALDIGFVLISVGLNALLNVFFPNLSISDSYKAFFNGVHEAAASKLQSK